MRVLDADVKEILDTEIDTTAFIIAANLLVDAKLLTQGYSDTQLREIERWLAAHFACIADPREAEVTVGASVVFEKGLLGKGLDYTRYGQQVKLLDTSGVLAALGKMQAKIRVAKRLELDPEGNPV